MKFNRKILIDNKYVGLGCPTYIIAEAGVSHFGSEEKAFKLVDLACQAGADSIKFQVFDVDEMISSASQDWKERLCQRQLKYSSFEKIQEYCKEKKITFFATAHDIKSFNFLCSINVPVFKIGSGEIGNWSFIEMISKEQKPVIISTGMYDQNQIKETLNVILSTKNKDIIVLHCVTDYPANPKDIALGNINLIKQKYNIITGYSDHTNGYHIPLASVAFGAQIIEKHITLDYNIPNAQDWKVSCGPDNLAKFISEVRDIEASLNIRVDGPTANEKKSMLWASKSIVSARKILKNEIISKNDIVFKRPGSGISPLRISEVIGRRSKRNIEIDTLINYQDLV